MAEGHVVLRSDLSRHLLYYGFPTDRLIGRWVLSTAKSSVGNLSSYPTLKLCFVRRIKLTKPSDKIAVKIYQPHKPRHKKSNLLQNA